MHTRASARTISFGLVTALVVASAGFCLVGCKDDEPQNIASAPPVIPAPPPPPVVEQPKEKPVYVYSGDRFRDPFIPAGTTGSYQPDAVFDPSKSTVKGIIFGPSAKSAVLTATGGGTYFVKEGKIFDIMGKVVEGFSAKVFAEKVVILGEADNTFELKIRNEEEKSL
jgi:hypothetical protein